MNQLAARKIYKSIIVSVLQFLISGEMEKEETPVTYNLVYVDIRMTLIRRRRKSPIIFIILKKENISIEGTFSDIISPQFHFLFSPQN